MSMPTYSNEDDEYNEISFYHYTEARPVPPDLTGLALSLELIGDSLVDPGEQLTFNTNISGRENVPSYPQIKGNITYNTSDAGLTEAGICFSMFDTTDTKDNYKLTLVLKHSTVIGASAQTKEGYVPPEEIAALLQSVPLEFRPFSVKRPKKCQKQLLLPLPDLPNLTSTVNTRPHVDFNAHRGYGIFIFKYPTRSYEATFIPFNWSGSILTTQADYTMVLIGLNKIGIEI